MNSSPFSQKEFLTGLLYALFGAAAVLIGNDYGFGSMTDMGAGFFPIILGYILLFIGAVTLVRAFMIGNDGEESPLRTIYWKGFALIVGGTALFAWLLPLLGLAIALPVLILLSAMASTRFSLSVKSLSLLVAFCALCVALFVRGLGVPMPILGTVFG
ncbi:MULTISPECIES: tripartite tricarboxylate transporter TctB family protein [Agrobacterium]|uniref:tripartite tricarboxylate transporter TctB family protein n=1 Tax=Agrobacterium tumefaciens TaxID=358 RepID=UPI000EF1C75D|nr:hypothetical protein At1D1108_51180 [Agrobacterium tumefaciens]NSY09857.1 tripartite tricarboxylate transporter TctB family protein [Agrobacterium tumefaciens]NSY93451.1 tripartite tricarboxylate transporter TctB family protein [Agrobacterium tumefaciens]